MLIAISVIMGVLIPMVPLLAGVFVLIPIALIFVVLLLMYPLVGYYMLLTISFFMFYPDRILRTSLPTGIVIEGLMFILLLGTLYQKRSLRQSFPGPVGSPINLMLLVYILYLLIEAFNGNMRSYEGLLFYYRKVTMFIVFYYVTLHLLDSRQKIMFFFKYWIFMSGLAGFYACIQDWFGLMPFEMAWLMADPHLVGLYYQGGVFRKFSFLSDPSACGILLAYSAILTIGFYQYNQSKKRKRLLLLAIFMILGAVYTGTRTCYIVFIVGLVMYLFLDLQSKKTLGLAISATIILGVVLFGPFYSPAFIRIRTLFRSTEDDSMKVRDENRKAIQPYLRTHPMGGGLATNGVEGERFNPGHPLAGKPADNGYLKFALEAGWLGLIVLILLYYVVVQQCVQFYYRTIDPGIKMVYRVLAAAMFSQMIAHFGQTAIGQMPGIFFFFASLAIINRLHTFDSDIVSTDQDAEELTIA
ncbi:MAG TPA: O-antigen ligase family protein [Phnomibacter sp.]|nr:O-antigen ligase family protein [Phnomibacter sp.]